MSGKTKIEWADWVWNPVVGCTPVSEGCRNCYARLLHERRHKAFTEGKKMPWLYARPFEDIQIIQERLLDPYGWRRENQKIFVNSVSDLFHPLVDWKVIDEIMRAIACTAWKNNQFLVLTKRPEVMFNYFKHAYRAENPKPLRNLWLGVSVEDQKSADERIPWLLKTPAAVRFVSVEPMLGPVDLSQWMQKIQMGVASPEAHPARNPENTPGLRDGYLNWVICGGETGKEARPMNPEWARSLRDQCVAAGVPFFFKGWGEWLRSDADPKAQFICTVESHKVPKAFGDDFLYFRVGRGKSGRSIDGREWSEFPEYPGVASAAMQPRNDNMEVRG